MESKAACGWKATGDGFLPIHLCRTNVQVVHPHGSGNIASWTLHEQLSEMPFAWQFVSDQFPSPSQWHFDTPDYKEIRLEFSELASHSAEVSALALRREMSSHACLVEKHDKLARQIEELRKEHSEIHNKTADNFISLKELAGHHTDTG